MANQKHKKLEPDGHLTSVEAKANETLERRVAERTAALRESKEQLRLFVEYAPVAIAMLDAQMHYVAVSSRWLADYNLTGQQVEGRSHYELFPEIPERWKEIHRRCLAGAVERAEEDRFERADGSTQWVRWEVRPWYSASDTVGGIIIFSEDVTERKQTEDALKFLVQCGSPASGEDFFQSLARYLGQSLGMDFVCIDRLEENLLVARTVAVYFDDKFEDNVAYTLKDTPCGDVVGKRICCFAKDVRHLFPKDKVLQDMKAESYVGTTLWSSQGKPIGLIAIIGRKPLADAKLATSILQLAAVRAAGELERRQAENALQFTMQRFYVVLSSMYSGILLVTDDGQVEFVNQALCNQFGLKDAPADLVGLGSGDMMEKIKNAYLHPDEAVVRIRQIVDRGQPVKSEELAMRSGRTCLRDFVPLNVQGKSYGRLWLHFDITERKEQEEELHKFNRVLKALNNSSQAMVRAADETNYLHEVCKIIDKDCGYAMVWIGYAEDDEAKTVRPVIYAGFEEGYLETLKITWADTERGRGPTGTAIRTGKVCMCRNMLTDPAFEPWRKEAIKRSYASSMALPLVEGDKAFGALTIYSKKPDPFSEDEVHLLTEVANDLAYGIIAIRSRVERSKAEEQQKQFAEELKRSNNDLEQFAHIASHDLREPLRAINGFVGLLGARYADKLDDKGREFIKLTADSANRMDGLLTGLLNYSRVQTHGKEFSSVPAGDAFRAALANLQLSIAQTKAVITSDELPTVNADGSQLTQLFQNLISNAIKFRGEKEPQIHVGCQKKDGFRQFSVRDNGIGIDPQFSERIFVIFQRLHTRDKYPGHGIGLSICKRIVERHGGEIWVESTPGCGSTFYFTVPDKEGA